MNIEMMGDFPINRDHFLQRKGRKWGFLLNKIGNNILPERRSASYSCQTYDSIDNGKCNLSHHLLLLVILYAVILSGSDAGGWYYCIRGAMFH